MREPRRRLSALATAGLDREGQEPGQHIPTQPAPAVSPRPPGSARPIGREGRRASGSRPRGARVLRPPPSGGSRDSPQARPPERRSLCSPAGPPPPRAATHHVVTAEPNRRAQGQTATAAFGRPTRAEHARTPESQGPVWPVTPAINRSPDPALPPSLASGRPAPWRRPRPPAAPRPRT